MSEPQVDDTSPLLPWTLSFMRPYRGRVIGVGLLMLLQVGLGALKVCEKKARLPGKVTSTRSDQVAAN